MKFRKPFITNAHLTFLTNKITTGTRKSSLSLLPYLMTEDPTLTDKEAGSTLRYWFWHITQNEV